MLGTFEVDSDMINEINRLEECKGADAVLIVQQTGPLDMDFELRVEVSRYCTFLVLVSTKKKRN